MPTPTPQQIDRFQIQSLLGRGGMGSVYRAWDPTLKRTVALKMLTRINEADDVRRFLREARTIARLQHPNICPVHEHGTGSDGRPFLVMELIDGQPLDRLIEKGPLPPAQAATLLEKVSRAIHLAHQNDILHRDLKPHNIIVRQRDGEPVLLDFGLARFYESAEEQITHSQDQMVAGTPAYMSPEQINGKQATPRSDVFGLGATLYHALAGQPPFGGLDTPLPNIIKQVLFDDPTPVSNHAPEVSKALAKVCHKALAKNPKKRYQSAAQLADALSQVLNQPEPPPSRISKPMVGALVLAALAVGAAPWLMPASPGRLILTTNVSGVEVWRGDQKLGDIGDSGELDIEIPAGLGDLSLRRGGLVRSLSLEVSSGETSRVETILSASVELVSSPSAQLTLHPGGSSTPVLDAVGKSIVDRPTPFSTHLPMGRYVATLTAPGHHPRTIELVAHPETPDTSKVAITLVPFLQERFFRTLHEDSHLRAPPAIGDVNGDGWTDILTIVATRGRGADGSLIALSGRDGQTLWLFDRWPTNIWSRVFVEGYGTSPRVVVSVLLEDRTPGLVWLEGSTGEILKTTVLLPERKGDSKAPWRPQPLDRARTGRDGFLVPCDTEDHAILVGVDPDGQVRWGPPTLPLLGKGFPSSWSGAYLAALDTSGDGRADAVIRLIKGVPISFRLPDQGPIQETLWTVLPQFPPDHTPIGGGRGPFPAPDGQSGMLFELSYEDSRQRESRELVILDPITSQKRHSLWISAERYVQRKELWCDVDADGRSEIGLVEYSEGDRSKRVLRIWDLDDPSGSQVHPIGDQHSVLLSFYPHPELGELAVLRHGSAQSRFRLELMEPLTGRVVWSQATNHQPLRIVPVDLDGDGRAELVVSTGAPPGLLILEAPEPADNASPGQ